MRKDVKNIVDTALENLKMAKDDLEDKSYRGACFWAQQAAELFIKAYLVYRNVFNPHRHLTHNLLFLIEECIKVDKDFEELLKIKNKLRRLSEYAISSRYFFGNMKKISEEEAKEAIEIAEKVKEFVLNKLKGKLE
ncbi:MAG: HEPN domain-containing protein [Candidatus Aenigmatarchaeota archaeon]